MRYEIIDLTTYAKRVPGAEYQAATYKPMLERGPDGGSAKHVGNELLEGDIFTCGSEEGAVMHVRRIYPDAVPAPFLDRHRNPVLLVWASPAALASEPAVLSIRAVGENRQEHKSIGSWVPRQNDRPYTLSLWMKGVIPAPDVTLMQRSGAWRDEGSIGAVAVKVTIGAGESGRRGLWFHQVNGEYAGSITFDASTWADLSGAELVKARIDLQRDRIAQTHFDTPREEGIAHGFLDGLAEALDLIEGNQ